jgi:hypothetical protein
MHMQVRTVRVLDEAPVKLAGASMRRGLGLWMHARMQSVGFVDAFPQPAVKIGHGKLA